MKKQLYGLPTRNTNFCLAILKSEHNKTNRAYLNDQQKKTIILGNEGKLI